jgi:hypothetical protein
LTNSWLQTPVLIPGDLYEKWQEEARLDIRASSGAENTRAQENSSKKNSQTVEAN